MAAPNYHPVETQLSPLEETRYKSPVSYAEPFPVYDTEHSDVGQTGIELRERPVEPKHQHTGYSTTTSLFHGQSNNETQSFLHDPVSKIDTFYSSSEYQPYKDNTGRQLRHILIEGSSRWLITFSLCAGYVLATVIWQKKPAQSEASKKMYNAITTAISIALGLNIASAFKDMALNMRWVILSNRKRNLIEMDLLLRADSMQTLTRLVFVTRRPMVIIGCIFWLLVNLLAQAGIAMVSLTYGFNTDTSHVQYQPGNVSVPDMNAFWPQGNFNESQTPLWQDQAYTAHVYGESAYNLGVNDSWFPKQGDIYDPSSLVFTYNSNVAQVLFLDSPTDAHSLTSSSIYTSRIINTTYVCESHKVTSGGDGSTLDIEVATVGNVTVYLTVPNSTTFFVAQNSNCGHDGRCQVVQAFEASDTDPWYYKCNITLSNTYNDPKNVSFISDFLAEIAASSIAQTGFVDSNGATGQIYPQNSPWGRPAKGDVDLMGTTMAIFAAGSIAGATYYNPYTVCYEGLAPSQGVYLDLGHPYFFYLILGLITVSHLVFLIVVAVLANKVMVGPDGALSMALLLRPIADALDGVSGGKENKVFKDAKRNTMVKYEKARNGRWTLHMN